MGRPDQGRLCHLRLEGRNDAPIVVSEATDHRRQHRAKRQSHVPAAGHRAAGIGRPHQEPNRCKRALGAAGGPSRTNRRRASGGRSDPDRNRSGDGRNRPRSGAALVSHVLARPRARSLHAGRRARSPLSGPRLARRFSAGCACSTSAPSTASTRSSPSPAGRGGSSPSTTSSTGRGWTCAVGVELHGGEGFATIGELLDSGVDYHRVDAFALDELGETLRLRALLRDPAPGREPARAAAGLRRASRPAARAARDLRGGGSALRFRGGSHPRTGRGLCR